MNAPDYFYRRRFVREPGLRHIFHDSGPARVWRDDEACFGYDFALDVAERIGTLKGIDSDGVEGLIVPIHQECRFGRLWLWRTRPLSVFAMHANDGTLAATRIDFASPLATHADALFQTDLYLDIFVSADERRFVVDDEDELETARSLGFISHENYRRVQEQRGELVDVLRAGQLAAWLGPFPPFDLARIPLHRSSIGRYIQPSEPDLWPEGLD